MTSTKQVYNSDKFSLIHSYTKEILQPQHKSGVTQTSSIDIFNTVSISSLQTQTEKN